ncbi:MAG TPA: hypothetical protein VIK53_03945 [Verrucomicrobiae bacterium]
MIFRNEDQEMIAGGVVLRKAGTLSNDMAFSGFSLTQPLTVSPTMVASVTAPTIVHFDFIFYFVS